MFIVNQSSIGTCKRCCMVMLTDANWNRARCRITIGHSGPMVIYDEESCFTGLTVIVTTSAMFSLFAHSRPPTAGGVISS